MKATLEIIAIGDELLNGLVEDTNSSWLGRRVGRLGVEVRWRQVVADRPDDIVSALLLAAGRSSFCVVGGGLGPTVDDRTAEAVGRLLGEELVLREEAVQLLQAHRARAGRLVSALDEKQARLPASVQVLPNPVGTAPAFAFRHGDCRFFCFPGVPRELKKLCETVLVAELEAASEEVPCGATWRFFGKTEAELASRVAALDTEGITLHFRPTFPEIHLWVSASGPDRLARFRVDLDEAVGRWCYAEGSVSFAQAVVSALASRGWTLATAESCTGGLIAQMITSVSGSSDVFGFGAVTYANEAKRDVLGVSEALLEQHGAVSEPVVVAMAEGARRWSGATLGVAVSGIAGPGGGSADKPVGTIHLALATPDLTKHRLLHLPFDRERNRTLTAYAALEMVRRICRLPEVGANSPKGAR